MSNRRSLLAYHNLRNLFLLVTRYRSRVDRPIPYYPHPVSSATPKHRFGYDDVNQGLQLLYVDYEVHSSTDQHVVTNIRNNNIDGNIKPVSIRPNHDYPSWIRWIFGAILSIFLPFWKEKWNKLMRLEVEVEMAVEVVEHVAEGVEKVAAVSEKLSGEIADKVSDNNRKLKEAALFVGRVSKEVEKDARLTEDIIHKVNELKQEVDMLIESVVDKPVGKGKFVAKKD